MTAEADFWTKAGEARLRVRALFDRLTDECQGDVRAAGRRLWQRSRHDSALAEDMLKLGCAHMVETWEPQAFRIPPPIGPKGVRAKLDKHPEVAAYVRERLGLMDVRDIAAECKSLFGPERAPGKSAIYNYWQRLSK